MSAYSLKDHSIAELERLLEAYPWFSIARKELFLKMSAMGDEYRKDALRRAVLFLYPYSPAFREGYVLASGKIRQEQNGQDDRVYDLDLGVEAEEDGHDEAAAHVPAREVIFVGGDYFMPEDLKNVQDAGLSTLMPDACQEQSADRLPVDSGEFTDETLYTETLAKVYADQELYDRANEVYEKLILLYPEKSAYFAALINDIKKHL
ncbi:MAG TPA: hypothetical protein IAC03_00475 [Candidatus Coprenecus pullistercoris]|nr:hypothetical protein [Candidatus Coprenecus pullistercoris]